MTEMVHAFGDVSLLCRDMVFYNDIVPATNNSSSNSIGDSSSKPIASNQLAQSNTEPGLGVPILFPSLPFPEKGVYAIAYR